MQLGDRHSLPERPLVQLRVQSAITDRAIT